MSDPQVEGINPVPDGLAAEDPLMSVLLTDLLEQWEELEAGESGEDPADVESYAEFLAGPPAELFDIAALAQNEAAAHVETPVIEQPPLKEPEPEPPARPQMPAEPTRRESLLRLLSAMYPEVAPKLTGQAAADIVRPEDRAGKDAYVVFRLAGESFAMPLRNVVEADRVPRVTAVPFVPEFVRGVTNRRGEVLPLVDLRTLLGLDSESAVQDDEGRMLVVRRKENEAPTALVVDGLRGIAWMRSRPARPEFGTIAGQVAGLLTGAGEHREAIVHILDVDRLFKSRQLG